MKDDKFMIVDAEHFGATIYAMRLFVDEFWAMIDELYRKDPDHPALEHLMDEGHVLDTILKSLDSSIVKEEDALETVFKSDYLLLSDSTKERFIYNYTLPESTKLH